MILQTKPYLFQREDAAFIERFGGRVLLASDPGCGKTLVSLLWAYRNPDVRPIVVICPASAKWVWQAQCWEHFQVEAQVLESTYPYPPDPQVPILIINYDILGFWIETLSEQKPKLVIFDECHAISNPRTKRSLALRTLLQDVPHAIAISGTPLTNRPSELWHVLNLLRPDLYPKFFPFALRYCGAHKTTFGWKYDGATNLETLHTLLTDQLLIRRRRADVLSQLPAKQRMVVPLDLDNRAEYEKAEEDLVAWLLDQNKVREAIRASRSLQFTKIGYLKRLVAKLKLRSVFRWIDEFLAESDEKLILFAVHKEIVKEIYERYPGQCAMVTGAITGAKREQEFQKFLTDNRVRLFIGNIKAAGTAWSAPGVSTVAFVELAWTPGDHTQCEDRVCGIGRGVAGVHSRIFYLVAHSTVEQRICTILQKKQKTLSTVLDGGTQDNDIAVLDQLVSELIHRHPLEDS